VKPVGDSQAEPRLHIHIKRSRGWAALNLHELWEYRELLYLLTWRDIKVRYKQTALGGTWAILQPVLLMIVFSLFFGKLLNAPSDGIPYPVFTFCALLPWQLFAYALTQSGNSLVANQQLITKVYFPRLIIPVAAVLSGLVDFGIAFGVLLAAGIGTAGVVRRPGSRLLFSMLIAGAAIDVVLFAFSGTHLVSAG